MTAGGKSSASLIKLFLSEKRWKEFNKTSWTGREISLMILELAFREEVKVSVKINRLVAVVICFRSENICLYWDFL